MTIIPGRLSEYRKRLSDPGRRSTIPNAYLQKLNPQLYAKRQANVADAKRTARNDVLYDPVRQLTGSQIYSLSKAQASSQYDPAINNAIQDRRLAIANDAALAERVAGYNQMASSALATAHEQAQSGASDLAAKLAGTNSSLMTQLGNDQGRDQQFAQDDAALRGAQNSPGMSERLAADFKQQRQGIAANAAAQETAGNVQAQGWAGLLGMMQGAQAMQGADNLTQIRNASAVREDKLGRDITGLRARKVLPSLTTLTSFALASSTRLPQSRLLTLRLLKLTRKLVLLVPSRRTTRKLPSGQQSWVLRLISSWCSVPMVALRGLTHTT
jgi:hypothetical protein